MPRRAKIQSFYSHGENSVQVEFLTIGEYPHVQGYLRVLTPEGDFNFILDSLEEEKLELLYQSLRKSLLKVFNLLYPRKRKSDES
jgi:exonuclease VII large subunit